MKYIGLQSQISNNNRKSLLLLVAFPLLVIALVWLFFFIFNYWLAEDVTYLSLDKVNNNFILTIPWVSIAVTVWFLVAWMSHSAIIRKATGAKPLERKENKRVYNLTENLCMAQGIKMPKVYVIEDDSLNAYASGISEKTYAVTLSRGMINKLNDEELEAVIAHELTHIINRDVRLLIISIVFVGIFAFITEIAFRSIRFGGGGRKKEGAGAAILIILVLGLIGLALSTVFRFALSRKREYLADAGAAEMTRKPWALASALKKVSQDPWIEAVKREDVAQMFIEHPTKEKKGLSSFLSKTFATHPPIDKRIQILEQF